MKWLGVLVPGEGEEVKMKSLLELPARSAAPHSFVLQEKTQIIPDQEDIAGANHHNLIISVMH